MIGRCSQPTATNSRSTNHPFNVFMTVSSLSHSGNDAWCESSLDGILDEFLAPIASFITGAIRRRGRDFLDIERVLWIEQFGDGIAEQQQAVETNLLELTVEAVQSRTLFDEIDYLLGALTYLVVGFGFKQCLQLDMI